MNNNRVNIEVVIAERNPSFVDWKKTTTIKSEVAETMSKYLASLDRIVNNNK